MSNRAVSGGFSTNFPVFARVIGGALLFLALSNGAWAQEAFDPDRLPPVGVPGAAANGAGTAHIENVEKQELPPLDAPAGDAGERLVAPNAPGAARAGAVQPASGWRGLGVAELNGLVSKITIPSPSPVLQGLLIGLFSAEGARPADGGDDLLALRLAVLYKAGQLEEIVSSGDGLGEAAKPAVLQAFHALSLLGLSQAEKACAEAAKVTIIDTGLPDQVAGHVLLLNAYCAALGKSYAPAMLSVDLAREQGVAAPLAVAVIESLSAGIPLKVEVPKRLTLLDYAFLRLGKWKDFDGAIGQAEPAALMAMVFDAGLDRLTHVRAVEEAAKRNVVAPEALGRAYGDLTFSARERERPLTTALAVPLKRGLLYQSAEAEKDTARKVRLVSALLDDARREKLYAVTAKLLARDISAIPSGGAYAGFAETAIEASVAAGNFNRAVDWASASANFDARGGAGLTHWLTLIDLASGSLHVPAGEGLRVAADYAASGGFSSDALHRLVTVLDALDYNVPIPLWDAASRTPQPKGGFLPETGHLSRLQAAAKAAKGKEDGGKTLLLAMAALGPDGPEGAHMLALGDTIRALKEVGYENEARLVGFEALFSIWPRRAGH